MRSAVAYTVAAAAVIYSTPLGTLVVGCGFPFYLAAYWHLFCFIYLFIYFLGVGGVGCCGLLSKLLSPPGQEGENKEKKDTMEEKLWHRY